MEFSLGPLRSPKPLARIIIYFPPERRGEERRVEEKGWGRERQRDVVGAAAGASEASESLRLEAQRRPQDQRNGRLSAALLFLTMTSPFSTIFLL